MISFLESQHTIYLHTITFTKVLANIYVHDFCLVKLYNVQYYYFYYLVFFRYTITILKILNLVLVKLMKTGKY